MIALVLVLAGCQEARKPEVPKVVYVSVEKPVALPESLTKPCPPVRVKSRTVEAVVSAYNTNIEAQADCDSRMAEIRKLQPTAED